MRTCSHCLGKGSLLISDRIHAPEEVICSACGGEGEIDGDFFAALITGIAVVVILGSIAAAVLFK